MLRHAIRCTALIGATLALSGCATIFGKEFAARWSKPRPAATSPEAPAKPELARYTDEGRRQLADGQTGAALDSFRLALLSGEPSGPAYNGLGVAYVRLGMFDNAQKLFAMAIEAAPNEQRYRDNLARLMVSPLVATRRDGERSAAVAAAGAELAAAKPAPATAAALRPGQLERVSRGEFRIVTVPQTGTAPAADTKRTAMARLPKVMVAKPAAAKAVPDADKAAPAAAAKSSETVAEN